MNFLILVILLTILNGTFSISRNGYRIKYHFDPENRHCVIISEENLKSFKSHIKGLQVSTLYDGAEDLPNDTLASLDQMTKIYAVSGENAQVVQSHLNQQCSSQEHVPKLSVKEMEILSPEVRKMVDSGDSGNRIDVVFMGDGYQAAEKSKFFSDMDRLVADMFGGETFSSYLPLFNIWAIYVESVDSGIGYYAPINTPFRLTRTNGELRLITTQNVTFARQICQLTGTSGCDHPSIIGNDDFYGGSGGEFVISTRSVRTGNIVLRHEMGHNFISVGDEYDNSWAYFGANTASNLNNVGWSHWLTNGPEKREERATYRLLEYPWADLAKGPQTFIFNSDGMYSRWYLQISVSAAGETDSLGIILDGTPLPWTSSGYDDREFYSWDGSQGFTQGSHNLTVWSKTPSTHPAINRMLCSATIYEFGNSDEFEADNNHISAYPTWDDQRRKTLRPTNAGCLMRNMTHNSFCPICKEEMWLQFFGRIAMIDDVEILGLYPDGSAAVQLHTLKLGQFRSKEKRVEGEMVEITWFWNGVHQEILNGNEEIHAKVGDWRVVVQLITPEVRQDPNNHLRDEASFTV